MIDFAKYIVVSMYISSIPHSYMYVIYILLLTIPRTLYYSYCTVEAFSYNLFSSFDPLNVVDNF